MPKRPTPYVPRGPHTLDDIDWNDPRITEDIRRVFAVLAEIEPAPTTQPEQLDKEDTEKSKQASTKAYNDETARKPTKAQEHRKPL